MSDTRSKFVAPSISETAFNCPHCGALARQSWSSVHIDRLMQPPTLWNKARLDEADLTGIKDPEERQEVRKFAERAAQAYPFAERRHVSCSAVVVNLHVSLCFNCEHVCLWLYDRLIYPDAIEAPPPNSDLPPDVERDYREAAAILDRSPRGAAALLRLAIQKMCAEIGGKGDNINDDIASMVAKGLDVRVQQALDVVRVVGNNAVHPGTIDLTDDRATAETLFSLVNMIAEIMISQPKHLQQLYDGLPAGAKAAIEKRDGKTP